MTARPARRGPRGMTLIEVMAAGAVLLVSLLGFVAASRYAMTANALGHRRTTTTFLRGELIDRVTVIPRAALLQLNTFTGAAADPAFVIDGCYDVNGVATSRNTGWADTAFTCGAGTVYRSWVGAKDVTNATWNVWVYVERLDSSGNGCPPASRFSAEACSAANLVLTD